jgi:RimJ/RimL family protein N-acetyltransferase
MITKQDLIYRQIVNLSDGGRVLLRPLTRDDRQPLLDLYRPVNSDERRYFRHDASQPEVVEKWIDELDYNKVFPIVAIVNDRIVGNATLHFGEGPARHRGEIRIFLSKEIRGRGIGTRMLQALINVAKRRNLCLLEVQILSDQNSVIRAFKNLGFELRSILEDYFILPDGEMRDIAHLVLHLHDPAGEF